MLTDHLSRKKSVIYVLNFTGDAKISRSLKLCVHDHDKRIQTKPEVIQERLLPVKLTSDRIRDDQNNLWVA